MCPVLTSKPVGFAKSSLFAFQHLPFLTPNRLTTSLHRYLFSSKRPQPFSQLLQIPNCSLKDKEMVVSAVDGVTRVEFGVETSLDFGLSFKICGSCKALGDWNLESAPALTWSEGHIWNLILDLPIGKIEAKLVVISSDGEFVDWEPGENRVLQIPEVSGEEIVHFDLKYLETENNERSINESEEEQDSEAQTTMLDPEIKDSIQEPNLETNDSTREPEVSMSDPMPSTSPPSDATIEDEQSSALKDEQSSASEDEQSSALKDEQSSALKDEQSSALKDEQSSASEDEVLEVVAEMEDESIKDDASLVKQDQEKEDSKVDSVQSTNESIKTSTESILTNPPEPPREANVNEVVKKKSESRNKQETIKAKKQEAFKANRQETVKQDKQETTKNEESSSEIVWLSILGFLSLPVVAWSEWSLYRTGCGLPPGPGGLLGAVEGIGYLVITGVSLLALFQRLKVTSKRVSILIEASSALLVVFGLFVLLSQIENYGYIPSALPDQNCPAQPTEIALPMIFSK